MLVFKVVRVVEEELGVRSGVATLYNWARCSCRMKPSSFDEREPVDNEGVSRLVSEELSSADASGSLLSSELAPWASAFPTSAGLECLS